MATYLYHCRLCGFETTHVQPMTEPVPETLEGRWHEVPGVQLLSLPPKPMACRTDTLHRAYGPSYANFGFRPHRHNGNQEHMFRNLG